MATSYVQLLPSSLTHLFDVLLQQQMQMQTEQQRMQMEATSTPTTGPNTISSSTKSEGPAIRVGGVGGRGNDPIIR